MKSEAARSSARRPGRPVGARPGEARAALLRAARELMSEKGLPQVTAREVALRANLNPGLVQYYFGGKDGLLRAVVTEISEEGKNRALLRASSEGGASDRMRSLIASMIQGFFADPYSPRLLFEQVVFAGDDVVDRFVDEFASTHVEALRNVLEQGQRTGEFRDIEPELAIPAIVGSTIFYFLASPVFQRVFERGALTPEQVERFTGAVASLVMDGIRGREEPV